MPTPSDSACENLFQEGFGGDGCGMLAVRFSV